MFVTKPRIFLAYVFENRFAVPSFNVSNLEMARAVIEAAELEDAPVMVQTDFINFNYGGMDELSALIRTLAEKAPVPVLMHQDHPYTARRHALIWTLLSEIAKSTAIPLVLHAGSGIHPEDTKAAAMLNVYKINIGAALIHGFVRGLEEAAALPPDHEPRHQQILRHVVGQLRDIARNRLSSFGASSHGKRLLTKLVSAKETLPGEFKTGSYDFRCLLPSREGEDFLTETQLQGEILRGSRAVA
ncbi:MAG: class II fructose-bisphosphate aldolase [Chthoniobacterales bacterium]